MKSYNDLVDKIADLHVIDQPTGFTPHPLALADQWIPSVVDTTTAGVHGEKTIIVAFGANYATWPNKPPTTAGKSRRTSAPWVEEDLSNPWRRRAIGFLNTCATVKTKCHWNGMMPFNWDQGYASTVTKETGENPHFVMTNLSPWITRMDWSVIRNHSLEDMCGILATPGMRTGDLWRYFRALKKCVGSDAIWVGHGNAEIYGIFRLICGELKIRYWFFDSNLSFPSQMVKFFTSPPSAVVSTATPITPTKGTPPSPLLPPPITSTKPS